MIDLTHTPLQSPNFKVLKQRALKSLSNPSEIDDDTLMLALQDSNEACRGKGVPNYIRIDFAYVRLKLYLKIDLNGEDELLFKNALEVISKANSFDIKGDLFSSRFYNSGIRENSI